VFAESYLSVCYLDEPSTYGKWLYLCVF
jgi:hypothetical protein